MTSSAILTDTAFDGANGLTRSIGQAVTALMRRQRNDGHFRFELEADAAIPAEYLLLKHFLGEVDPAEERLHTAYLRRRQESHGGWPMLVGGACSVSATVKCYFALKAAGDPVDAPHMVRAREAILKAGGAVNVNIFTRITLALFGIVPWRAVPVMPVELMHAPGWFPFHMFKVSFWARDTLAPLMVLMALKPRAANPRGITLDELFIEPPFAVKHWPQTDNQVGLWGAVFGALDRGLHLVGPLFPKRTRATAIAKAVRFVRERLNGEDGFGAIFPSVAYTLVMFKVLGEPEEGQDMRDARAAFAKLVHHGEGEAYCQPCLSPVWDTVLSAQSLMEAAAGDPLAAGGPIGGEPDMGSAVTRALDWLLPQQILDLKGDWAHRKPGLRPGGWTFMYANPHYPDLDDTALIVMAYDRARRETGTSRFDEAISRAVEWCLGMQSRNGGWGAYDADNTASYLNYIPFADHGALLDPPTADVTARVVAMLGQLGETADGCEPLRRGLAFLLAEQHPEGSWFGRWGINYVYGTWSVLCALAAARVPHDHPAIRRGVAWLVRIQNADGGWGEADYGYRRDYRGYRAAASAASQTAWAVLGLMAVGEASRDGAGCAAVRRGIAFLQDTQGADGFWLEDLHTGTGFPRVFYLRYDGYPKVFPLLALARYRNLAGRTLADGAVQAGF